MKEWKKSTREIQSWLNMLITSEQSLKLPSLFQMESRWSTCPNLLVLTHQAMPHGPFIPWIHGWVGSSRSCSGSWRQDWGTDGHTWQGEHFFVQLQDWLETDENFFKNSDLSRRRGTALSWPPSPRWPPSRRGSWSRARTTSRWPCPTTPGSSPPSSSPSWSLSRPS